jgi:hypothetical protein
VEKKEEEEGVETTFFPFSPVDLTNGERCSLILPYEYSSCVVTLKLELLSYPSGVLSAFS